MSGNRCKCGQPAPDGYLCPACRTRLGNNLERLPTLWDELSVKLAREKGFDYRGGADRQASETALPIDAAAFAERRFVWISVTNAAGQLGLEVSEVQTLVAVSATPLGIGFMCRLLRAHVNHIAGTEWGASFANAIDRKIDRLTQLIDSPPPRIYAGRCSFIGVIGPDGTPGDPDPDWLPCFAEMWVLEDDRPLTTTVRCPDCGATFSLATRREWVLQQYAGRLVTPTEGAALMGIPRATIYTWARRKRVLAQGDGLYLLDDLMELARAKRDDAA